MPDTLKRCSAAPENRLHFIGKDAPLYPQSRLHNRAMEPVFGSFGISFPMPRSIFFDGMLGGFISTEAPGVSIEPSRDRQEPPNFCKKPP